MADSPKKKLRLPDLLILLGVILANGVIIGILVRGFLAGE